MTRKALPFGAEQTPRHIRQRAESRPLSGAVLLFVAQAKVLLLKRFNACSYATRNSTIGKHDDRDPDKDDDFHH